jgi:hypothetical protein
MKPRRVVLTIEVETGVSLKDLKVKIKDLLAGNLRVMQVQANVIKGEK